MPASSVAALISFFEGEVPFVGCWLLLAQTRVGDSEGWVRGADGSHSSGARRGRGTVWGTPAASQLAAEPLGTRIIFFLINLSNKISVEILGELGSVGSGSLCERLSSSH